MPKYHAREKDEWTHACVISNSGPCKMTVHTGGPTRTPSGGSCGAVAVRQELRGELLMGEVCRQQAGGAACVAACVRCCCCAVAERSHHQIPASGDPVNGFFRRPVGGVYVL
jgi:hypothetical protein